MKAVANEFTDFYNACKSSIEIKTNRYKCRVQSADALNIRGRCIYLDIYYSAFSVLPKSAACANLFDARCHQDSNVIRK